MFTRLVNYQNDGVSRKLKRMLKSVDLKNIFNPSFITRDTFTIIAFRAINPEVNKINSYVATFGENEQLLDLINLSEYVAQFNIQTAADPKIFLAEGTDVWITFNTGYSTDYNDIYILRFYPKMGKPLCCHYEKRQKIEKNWAFFFEGNKILALYSITPLVILEAYWPCEQSNVCKFHELTVNGEKPKRFLSIGTQLTRVENGYLFVAHRKRTFFNKRMYYGVPIILNKKNAKFELYIGEKMKLIHSMRSVMGSKIKYNKNLLSCTYFSGINYLTNDQVVLGYGINDVDFSFASLDTSSCLG